MYNHFIKWCLCAKIINMKGSQYSDKNLEEFIQKHFGVNFGIDEVVSRDLPISYSAEAVIFRTKKKKLYAFLSSEARMTLGDMQYLLNKMNLKPAYFFPPNGYKDYFVDHAREQFLQIFPGREHVQDEELRYYKTRVTYNPALVEIAEVKNGEVRCFNSDSIGSWRIAFRLSYKKIITK